jgi:hypothetical protein
VFECFWKSNIGAGAGVLGGGGAAPQRPARGRGCARRREHARLQASFHSRPSQECADSAHSTNPKQGRTMRILDQLIMGLTAALQSPSAVLRFIWALFQKKKSLSQFVIFNLVSSCFGEFLGLLRNAVIVQKFRKNQFGFTKKKIQSNGGLKEGLVPVVLDTALLFVPADHKGR